ncbi:ATPase, T2SS/T4P/T4SS family [Demequina sp. B12]|uniref:CpaF family protein n=1 Tax=Demequina sp. B12 TaxID=2992757 RepID=UPI00237AD42D|nr:ATPase, T2SS/T4P/T4SS family [Demequina sp. B12]MDE0573597.1 ATPase, T2SS/T4P/T4SS family [Demequina sp. B12]
MTGEAAALIESQVRQRIRETGVDPIQDVASVRVMVDEALAQWDAQSLTGSVAPVADAAALSRSVVDSVAGLGPLQRYLDDPEVEEIWINSPTQVFVAKAGRSELTTTLLTDDSVRDLVERMLKSSGRRLDLSSPFVDATLPGGERLHVVIPDVTRRHWAVNIRKFVARAASLADMVALGSLSSPAAAFLTSAIADGANVLVSGATQAGKTTMLNALTGALPARERVVTCEEVFELTPASRDTVALQCRQSSLEGTGEIPLRRLVKEALRMRPDRIIVGEVREAEALDLLIALNSGVPGMCTVHANSARDAITKLCTLPLLAGENVTDRFVVPTVAASVDLVVHLRRGREGHRYVHEIVHVPGNVDGGVISLAPVFRHDGTVLVKSGV